jgi:hypothetical protein
LKKYWVILLIITLFLVPLTNVLGAEQVPEQVSKPILLETEPITAGALLKKYQWEMEEGNVNLYLIEVDLNNPHVVIDVIPGGGKITQRLNVSKMAKNTGAVAAINGDFYNMNAEGAPIGPMVMNTRLVSSPSKIDGLFALGITTERKAYIESFAFNGKVTAPNGASFELSGLNKTFYREEPDNAHSHSNKLHLYNDLWGGKTRGHDSYTTPTEMLVNNGKVLEILEGQYFDSPVPEGMYILRGHGDAARFILDNFQPGDSIDIDYIIKPEKDWSMVIGGHSLLVEEGKAVPYAKYSSAIGGVRARTAAGISKDGSTLYLVGVEGRTASSAGITLEELAKFFEEIGVWKAVNFDGGGSTTMVSRPLGEWDTQRVFPTEQTHERLVVNALGIYSTAPQGKLKGLLLDGEDVLLINEEVPYFLRGYDEYYNPINIEDLAVQWQLSDDLGVFKENIFIPQKYGSAQLTATVNSTKINMPIEVVGKNTIDKMILNGNDLAVASGSQIPLALTMVTQSGKEKQVSPSLVDWQFVGIDGKVSADGILTVSKTDESSDLGFVVARYQGFSAPLALTIDQEKTIYDFSDVSGLLFEAYPTGVTGYLSIVDNPDQALGGTVTRLDYDFSKGMGTTAAYIRFAGNGIEINQGVKGLMLDVYGNQGKQWLRAEIEDRNGNILRYDLTNNVDWSGWRGLYLDLENEDLTYPLKLRRIYVVSTEAQREQIAISGSLLFNNLRFIYTHKDVSDELEDKILELIVGKKEILVNDVVQEIDVAPVIVNNRTLVPLRFISEALGASVLWDNSTKNVTVINNKRWIDLWPGEDMMVVDGKAVDLDVPPQLKNNRTMLPLRAIAESLDLQVQWDPKSRRITLY